MIELPLAELLAAARAGGDLEKGRAYTILTPLLKAWALPGRAMSSTLQAKEELDDLLQWTWMRIWKALQALEIRSSAECAGWLRQVVRRTLLDRRAFWKAAQRDYRREDLFEEARTLSTDEREYKKEPPPPPRGPSLSHEVAKRIKGEAMLERVGRLPEDQRATVLLRLEGLSWNEIGGILNRSPEAAQMLFTRARRALSPLNHTSPTG